MKTGSASAIVRKILAVSYGPDAGSLTDSERGLGHTPCCLKTRLATVQGIKDRPPLKRSAQGDFCLVALDHTANHLLAVSEDLGAPGDTTFNTASSLVTLPCLLVIVTLYSPESLLVGVFYGEGGVGWHLGLVRRYVAIGRCGGMRLLTINCNGCYPSFFYVLL